MKVAVCLSGQPRNYKKSFQTIKNSFLSELDVDFYFHSWNDTEYKSTDFGNGGHKYSFKPSEFDKLIGLYQPVKYSIENPILFDASGFKCPIWRQPLNNTMSMYYSIYKSFNLVYEIERYDYIIRSRFDVDFSVFNPKLNGVLQIPKWHNDERVLNKGLHDAFAVGTAEDMKTYSSLFSYIISYVSNDERYMEFLSGGWPYQDSPLRNEYLLKWHLVNHKVNHEIFETKNLGIIR